MNAPKKKPPANKSRQENAPSFEQSLAELEQLVTHMEQGELTLEETVKSFERGIELNKMCQNTLDEAEQRVRILTEKEGKFEIEPFGEDSPADL
uniref:Exodeoxyribonuclease 7 small subunit n=1 Tax=Candidatus Kentrum sp. SD TaxID=2126332 RepID=A0A451BLL9_9GAMM|nr:MAG: Exodeoxyribonuclease VII small subunit [Candidatus Kentron sp. SD]VFK48417.1 MAG: Exodeoxyribonuclease VII small subunit [Candidatus Kentron sp. SD]VFK79195.1 MAG: Exodeoxyribonuclease VII small subunit [Candidatus Kentron sp. SD]